MILVCGEAIVDLTPAACGDRAGFVPRAGGSPCNVAVGLGRLDVSTGFVGGLSSDPFGRLLTQHLTDSGVDVSWSTSSDDPTPVAFVMLDEHGVAEYVFHLSGTSMDAVVAPPDPLPQQVRAVHVGSIGLVLQPAGQVAAGLLHHAGRDRLTTLDPNIRPRFIHDRDAYLEALGGWLRDTDVVKVGEEDLAWLHPGVDPVEVVGRWLLDGPTLAVLTRGPDGAMAVTSEGCVEVAGVAVDVVDTVGAGDAFMSALLAWLAHADALDRDAVASLTADERADALRFATKAAAWTCGRAGADPPRRADLEDR